jgi:hypothetical protein
MDGYTKNYLTAIFLMVYQFYFKGLKKCGDTKFTLYLQKTCGSSFSPLLNEASLNNIFVK